MRVFLLHFPLVALILASSCALPLKDDEVTHDEQRGNLATFIEWAVPVPDKISASSPHNVAPVLADTDIITTHPKETNPDPEVVGQVQTAAIITNTSNNQTSPAATPGFILDTTTPTSSHPSVFVELAVSQPNNQQLGPSKPNPDLSKEAIYQIRPGPTGSVAGIIREALGLVANTIRVVGINLSLLGLGLEPGGSGGVYPPGFTRINSTHFKLVSPFPSPIRGSWISRNVTQMLQIITRNATMDIHGF